MGKYLISLSFVMMSSFSILIHYFLLFWWLIYPTCYLLSINIGSGDIPDWKITITVTLCRLVPVDSPLCHAFSVLLKACPLFDVSLLSVVGFLNRNQVNDLGRASKPLIQLTFPILDCLWGTHSGEIGSPLKEYLLLSPELHQSPRPMKSSYLGP